MTDQQHPKVDVPAGSSTVECPYCGRPFARERYLTLHLGLDHYGDLDESEVAAFESEYEAESADLRTFQIKVVGVLVALYFGFLYVYSVFG